MDDIPRALDALARNSGHLRNEQFFTQMAGADNLLMKAGVALELGDSAKADRLITRAAAMPYDDREMRFPGVQAADSVVYAVILNAVEAADEDDSAWLDAALAAHEEATGPGKQQLACVLNGFVRQAGIVDLTPREKARIRAVARDAPLDVDHVDPDSTVGERADVIRSILIALGAYERHRR
ncbi:MAG: hypothetical protein V9G19_22130 [Tetrasphaera sp.]